MVHHEHRRSEIAKEPTGSSSTLYIGMSESSYKSVMYDIFKQYSDREGNIDKFSFGSFASKVFMTLTGQHLDLQDKSSPNELKRAFESLDVEAGGDGRLQWNEVWPWVRQYYLEWKLKEPSRWEREITVTYEESKKSSSRIVQGMSKDDFMDVIRNFYREFEDPSVKGVRSVSFFKFANKIVEAAGGSKLQLDSSTS